MSHFYTASAGTRGSPGAFHKGESKWLLRQKYVSGECTLRQQTSNMEEPDLPSHCLLIPKSNSLHRLYHQFLQLLLFYTVGLCLPTSSSFLILTCLGKANHPKEIPRGKSLCSYAVHKEEVVCSAYWWAETLPNHKEQDSYYLIMDSCFTLLQKAVLLHVWILAGFFHNYSVSACENLQSNSLTYTIHHPSFPRGVIVMLSLQVFSL